MSPPPEPVVADRWNRAPAPPRGRDLPVGARAGPWHLPPKVMADGAGPYLTPSDPLFPLGPGSSLFLTCCWPPGSVALSVASVMSGSLRPTNCSPPGSSIHGFSRQEYWSGVLPYLSPGNLPDPGIESRSPALQADSLPSGPPGKILAPWGTGLIPAGPRQPREAFPGTTDSYS